MSNEIRNISLYINWENVKKVNIEGPVLGKGGQLMLQEQLINQILEADKI